MIAVTKYHLPDSGNCLILRGTEEETREVAAQYFESAPIATPDAMEENEFIDLPEFEG